MTSFIKIIIFFFFLLLLLFSLIKAEDPSYVVGHDDDVALKIQLHLLNSKIIILESKFEEKINELRTKDDSINQMEKIIQEKSATISSLQNDIQAARGRGDVADNEQVGKAKAVMNEIDTRFQGLWVPHWVSVHLFHCQSFLSTHWKESVRPVLDETLQKVLQKKAEVGRWAAPHIETVKTKWLPVIRDQATRLDTQIEQRLNLLTTKFFEVYHTSKKFIEPHFGKLLEIVDPYFQKWVPVMKDQFIKLATQVCHAFKKLIEPLLKILHEIVVSDFQELKKFTMPYIDQTVAEAKPHLDNARVLLKPYTKTLTSAYKKLLKAFHLYHLQIQAEMRVILMNTVLSRPLASERMVWFSASAGMAIPVLFLFKLVSSICRRPKRRSRNSRTSYTRLMQTKKKGKLHQE